MASVFRNRAFRSVLFALLFLPAAIIGVRLSGRVDLSSGGLYTLSPALRSRIELLENPVRISYYLSPRLEAYSGEPARMREYLQEFAYASPLVEFRVVDAGVPENRDRALDYGLQPQQLSTSDRDSRSFITVFSGVVIEYIDGEIALPFVLNAVGLEYELLRAWDELVRKQVHEIAVLSGNQEMELRSAYQNALLRLSESFRVRLIELGEPIPDSADLVFIFGNKDLPTDSVLELESFLAAGGGVLISVEGVHVQLDEELGARELPESDLDLLLARYGVRVSRELVLDSYHMRVPLAGAPGTPESIVYYPHWIELQSRNAAAGHPLTEAVSGLDLFWPSRIELTGHTPSSLRATQLFTTSYEGRVMDAPFATNPALGIDVYERVLREGGDRIGVVLALEGVFPQANLSATAGSTGRLLLVGGGYTFSDFLELGENPLRNLQFLTAAGHWLSGDEDLLELLSRTSPDLRLNRLGSAELRRAVLQFAQWVNVVIIPAFVIVLGLWYIRRRRRA